VTFALGKDLIRSGLVAMVVVLHGRLAYVGTRESYLEFITLLLDLCLRLKVWHFLTFPYLSVQNSQLADYSFKNSITRKSPPERSSPRFARSYSKQSGSYCFRDSETGKQGLDRPFSIYTRGVWLSAIS